MTRDPDHPCRDTIVPQICSVARHSMRGGRIGATRRDLLSQIEAWQEAEWDVQEITRCNLLCKVAQAFRVLQLSGQCRVRPKGLCSREPLGKQLDVEHVLKCTKVPKAEYGEEANAPHVHVGLTFNVTLCHNVSCCGLHRRSDETCSERS